METIIFTITKKEDGLAAITSFTNAVKNCEAANHKFGFSQRMMGTYVIFNAMNVDEATKEIIFCPINRIELIGKGKNIVDTRNCMWFVGDSDLKMARLSGTISWMLDKGGIFCEDS